MNYPLFLHFTGTILGRGFAAQVDFDGRFLGVQESGGWWLHGVNPSAIAACGVTIDEANANLRDSLKGALAWLAGEAETFEAFKAAVNRFVRTTNDDYLADWDAAVERVRATKECLSGLPIKAAFVAVDVRVVQKALAELQPADNAPSSVLATANKKVA